MNGLAILAVVLNHARVWGVVAMVFWADRYKPVTVPDYSQVGSAEYYSLLVLDGIIQFAIPTFLFVSGFYIAIATGRSKSTIPWKTVLTRIKFLVIPYLIWFFIMSGVLYMEGERYMLFEYVKLLLTGYIQGPYYFVPMLVQLYLLSPFIVPFAKSNWKLLLLISAIIQVLTQVLLYFEIFQVSTPFEQFHVLPIWFFLTRIFWFVLGIIFGLHLQSFKVFVEKTRWMFLGLMVILLPISMFERHIIFIEDVTIPVETTIGSLYALSFIFVMLGFSSINLPLTNLVERTGSKSFGIYLTHSPAQEFTSRIIYHIAPWLLAYATVFTLLIFIVGLGIPIILMELARRSPLSRYYQYIFG
jgi:peptidoglycan/LPS O-acetylase OafA/YrhL